MGEIVRLMAHKSCNVCMALRMVNRLSNSDMQVSCHLVDIDMSMYPAGTEGLRGGILPWWQSSGSSFQESFVKDFLQRMLLSQPALYEKQRPLPQSLLWGQLKNNRLVLQAIRCDHGFSEVQNICSHMLAFHGDCYVNVYSQFTGKVLVN